MVNTVYTRYRFSNDESHSANCRPMVDSVSMNMKIYRMWILLCTSDMRRNELYVLVDHLDTNFLEEQM